MKVQVLSLLTGVICGFVFGKLKLPIPAPGVIEGIIGIIGIFLGYKISLML
jgi:XapX domain-containing protein